ncbi:DNA recombination protein RmuC [Lebetimonas sp. JS170]|uniref:DNA recombination protein RmuC n=1 Tax=Lebetimonas sp. JS170 TaxID=990073 RepID=UPI0004ACC42A|nr:DNA recombination protein RmuC [Lebetimonas sp. JS170]
MKEIYLIVILIVVLAFVAIGFMYYVMNKTKSENEKVKAEFEELNKIYGQTKENFQNHMAQAAVMQKEIENLEEKIKEYVNLKTEYEKLRNEKNRLSEEKSAFSEKLSFLEEIKEKYDALLKENQKDKALIKELQTKLNEEQKAYEEKLSIIKKSEEELKTAFENVANKILEENAKKLSNDGIKNFENILNPLNNNLKDFKERVNKLYESEIKNISSLFNELKNLKELNQQLSQDANNLTKALKGDVKKVGNWGEVVLERILEMSGLREGEEFKREVVFKDGNKILRPDVVVYLPNERIVIIDSKVSLNAYDEYVGGKEEALKNHLISVKRHIDTLAEKKYESLNHNSLDFILMFVPIEGALMLALENEPGLFEYAFKKRIILTSPTTLLAALRSIEVSWRYEKQAKNIAEVVKSAENLYDKIRGFIEDFEKVGDSIDKAGKSFESAKNKLITGRGNVISQISRLKDKAGIKPKKELPKDYVEIAKIESEK